ncbi:MAG: phosphoribosylamine--glycine ligase [Ktedonobacteraceae bacterium]|nr:phosphoribosylamine--glycine ligase [Chloroflexota bacterium]
MRVLVVGSGAREHALVWKLAQSKRVDKIYAAPGNPGMASYAECVSLGITQITELAEFAERNQVDLTVVGPELPLIEGIASTFRQRDLRIFGPDAAGASLEGSKAFAKQLLTEAGIPTAQHRTFTEARSALDYLEEHGAPVVIKADGNAAGKGAIVVPDLATAHDAVQQMMVERVFGSAGDVVVIEDYLEGVEIGSTAICDGSDYLPLVLTQDHKRALEGNQGPNTGGMGVFTPLPFVSQVQEAQVHTQVISATLQALARRGIAFSGVLYSNIMLTERGPMVLEHNTRFGDPETQAQMLLMQADLLDILTWTPAQDTRALHETLWRPGYAISVTLASGGYPDKYRTGLPITGIEEAQRQEGVQVFHAGTATHNGHLVTAAGRVLSVAASGQTLREAVGRAYEAVMQIAFEGMHYRRDIAYQGLQAR